MPLTSTRLPSRTTVATIPGLLFRPYAGDTDIPAMVELYRVVAQDLGVPAVLTMEQQRNELANPTHVDPARDLIQGFVGERLVAISSIEWADTAVGQRLYRSRGWVHPEWRRHGIGSAMLARNESRLVELAATHQHTQPPMLMTWFEDEDRGGEALVAERGYGKVRVYRHMTRPDMQAIDVAPLADGLEVRPVTRELLPRLWDAMTEAFRDHFGSHDDGPAAYRRWADDPQVDLDLWVVAFDGQEISAGVLGHVDPHENELFGYQRGWTDPVFTRRPWRRRGLASALLGRCLVGLRERGMTSAQLDVDTANANDALTLYERHGFRVDHGSSEWHKPLVLPQGDTERGHAAIV